MKEREAESINISTLVRFAANADSELPFSLCNAHIPSHNARTIPSLIRSPIAISRSLEESQASK